MKRSSSQLGREQWVEDEIKQGNSRMAPAWSAGQLTFHVVFVFPTCRRVYLGDFLILDCIAVLLDVLQDPRCSSVALLLHTSSPRAKTWLFYASTCHTDMQGLV
jgi:hypothetical protein